LGFDKYTGRINIIFDIRRVVLNFILFVLEGAMRRERERNTSKYFYA